MRRFVRQALLCGMLALTTNVLWADYTVQRVVGGLNQPMFMAQAPNDNTSLYIVERNDGGNQLGRIRRYDLQSQTLTTFLDLTGGITSDGGVLGMAFHPEYQANGRFYVTSNINGSNRLDEYQVVGSTPTFQRRLLEYSNLENVFHTINQVHFRPNGNNNEIFVTTGDGGTQADSPNFNPALIESPNSVYGKLLKIDLNASFPTPANDPTHAGVDVVALGLRNPYRSSFDRLTGDFYIGDVGFNRAEEVNFIAANHFSDPSAPILDFGWTDREGTIARVPGGGPGSPGDINPIFDYAHSGQPLPHPSVLHGQSITGGYVYRGVAPELQGRYFFSDFMNGNVYSGQFNTNTNPSQYDGTNLTDIINHTTSFEALIGAGANIQFVTSFAEDNSSNLYIVKFGNSFFPALGQGKIFRITPLISEAVEIVVDRESGAITLTNNTNAEVNLTSLTLNSVFGAINPGALTPITGNYDAAGNGNVDSNNNWVITSQTNSSFSEMTTGDAGTLGIGEPITFSPGDGWVRSPTEDLVANLKLEGGSLLSVSVSYIGNGGAPFERSDLNFDGELDAADWAVFLATSFTDLSGLSPASAYGMGDLNGDGLSDYDDFQVFKSDYNSVNGLGAFEAMIRGVPEPSSLVLLLGLASGWISCRRRQAAMRVQVWK